MTNIISISYIALVFCAFVLNYIYIKKRKPVLKKSFYCLKASKKCTFKMCALTCFLGKNVAVYVAKNNQTCYKFCNKASIFLQFYAENYGAICVKNETFCTSYATRNFALQKGEVCVKFEKTGVHITLHSIDIKQLKIAFFKPNNLCIKKVQTKLGFYVICENYKFGFFLLGARAKLFTEINQFGFLVDTNGLNNFSIIYQNFCFINSNLKLSKNLYKQLFCLPKIEDTSFPNFNSLFFKNEPLKTKTAKNFLCNLNFDCCDNKNLPQNVFVFDTVLNFESKFKKENFLLSLTDFGFSKFVLVSKRANLVHIFDALTKFRITLKFDCYVKKAVVYCFWGEVRLFIVLQSLGSFRCVCFGNDLKTLIDTVKINCPSKFVNILNNDYTFCQNDVFWLFNKAVLMGIMPFKLKDLKKLNPFVFKKKEQIVFSNLILSVASVFQNENILKSKIFSKLVLKNAKDVLKRTDEFAFLYLKKLYAFLVNLKVKNKLQSILNNIVPHCFKLFEGAFCNFFGINAIKQSKITCIKFSPKINENAVLTFQIFNTNLKIQFFAENYYKINENKFFGNTTFLV